MAKRIKPVSRIVKIEAEINRIAEQVFSHKRKSLGLDEGWIPYIDISEAGNSIIVRIEVPGVHQSDINILLFSNRVEITGQKKENLPQKSLRYHRLEREFGSFRRVVFLPCTVLTDKAQALLENGILSLTIKKLKSEKEVVVRVKKTEE